MLSKFTVKRSLIMAMCALIINILFIDLATARYRSRSSSSWGRSKSSFGSSYRSKRSRSRLSGSYESSSQRRARKARERAERQRRERQRKERQAREARRRERERLAAAERRRQERLERQRRQEAERKRRARQAKLKAKIKKSNSQVLGSGTIYTDKMKTKALSPVERMGQRSAMLKGTKGSFYKKHMRNKGSRVLLTRTKYKKYKSNYFKKRKIYPLYSMYPRSYGMWNSMYWWGCLADVDVMCTMAMFHHWNEPGFWMWWMVVKSAQDDDSIPYEIREDLSDRIAYIEGQVEQLEQVENRDPNFIPEDMTSEEAASVMLAEDVVVADRAAGATLKIGTGGQRGVYYKYCLTMQEIANETNTSDSQLNIECVNTSGSVYNIGHLQGSRANTQESTSNNFGAIMVQADTYNDYLSQVNSQISDENQKVASMKATPYDEHIFVIGSKSLGPKSVKEVVQAKAAKGQKLNVIAVGGGATFTWSVFSQVDPYRGQVNLIENVESIEAALAQFDKAPENSLITYVVGYNNGRTQLLEKERGSSLQILPFSDESLAQLTPASEEEGVTGPTYSLVKTYKHDYRALSSLWKSNSVDMLTVGANLVISGDWISQSSVFVTERLEDVIEKASLRIKKDLVIKPLSLTYTGREGNVEIPLDYSNNSESGEPVINICTGGLSGSYIQMGLKLKEALAGSAKVNVISTGGSGANLHGLLAINHSVNDSSSYKVVEGRPGERPRVVGSLESPECHLAVYQSDAQSYYFDGYSARFGGARHSITRLADVYPEVVFIVTHRNKDDESFSRENQYLENLSGTREQSRGFLSRLLGGEKDTSVRSIGVVKGSGAALTLKAMGQNARDYLGIIPTYYDSWDQVLAEMEQGENSSIDGFIYVGSPGTSLLKTLGNDDAYQFASFSDANRDLLTEEGSASYIKTVLVEDAFSDLHFWGYGGFDNWKDYPTVSVTARIGVETSVMKALQNNEVFGNRMWSEIESAVQQVVADTKAEKEAEISSKTEVECSGWFCF